MQNTNDFNFNGSTVAFAGVTLGALRSMDFSETGAQVDTTGAEDAIKTFRAGIPDPTFTVTIVGGLVGGTAIGTTGTLVVTWQDETTEGTLTLVIIVDRGQTGSMDGEITSTYTVKNAQANDP